MRLLTREETSCWTDFYENVSLKSFARVPNETSRTICLHVWNDGNDVCVVVQWDRRPFVSPFS